MSDDLLTSTRRSAAQAEAASIERVPAAITERYAEADRPTRQEPGAGGAHSVLLQEVSMTPLEALH